VARSVAAPAWRRIVAIAAAGVMAVALAGCAAQQAFREGRQLVDAGKVEEGIAKLREAVRHEPGNVQYRQTYLQLREQSIASLFGQAGRKLQDADYPAAKRLYQRALEVEPGNERALAGLAAIEAAGRHTRTLTQAQAAWSKNDRMLTEVRLRQILDENPQHAGALALMQSVREAATALPLETALAAVYQKPISLEFSDASLKQIFEVISRTSGLSFMFDKEVRTDQRTSIFLKKGSVESALHFILMSNQLDQQILDSNTVMIYPNTPAKQKEYQALLMKSFYLANADAKNVANTLKTLLKMQDVIVDEKLNMIVVRDSAAAIRLVERTIALHDVPEPEVMLEVEILEVKRSRLLDLGVQWPDSVTLSPLSSAAGAGLTVNDLRGLNRDLIGVSIAPVRINARKQDGDTNILANPRIRVRNHEKAKILIGERVPNITSTSSATGFVAESVNYVDIGLKLEVEPTIYLDGDVVIKVAMEVSNVVNQIQTKSGSVAYQIGTRNASTVLSLKDGENQVLAGLINDEDRNSANKIPLIGELPIVGRLFGSTSNEAQKTEIVLSITPRLVRNIRRPASDVAQFQTGTSTSFRLRPDALPAAAAGAPEQVAAVAAQAEAAPVASIADSGGATLTWNGPARTKVGDTFSLRLMMQANAPVGKLPMVLNVDPKVLQPIVLNEGEFLKKGGAKTHFTSKIDSSGQIQVTVARDGAGVAGEQDDVVTVDFRALAPAASAHVQLLSAAPATADGKPVSVVMPATYAISIEP
jgi:general secretion pathway protein D